MTALSLTDHGTLSGHRDFLIAAKDTKVKPILGLEAYFTTDRLDKRSKKERGEDEQVYNHLMFWQRMKMVYRTYLNYLRLLGTKASLISLEQTLRYQKTIHQTLLLHQAV